MPRTRTALLILAGLSPLALGAQDADLKKQLQELKKQVAALEEKAKDQGKTLTKVETKVAQNGISWGGDLRTRFDSQSWHFKPYTQFMGFAPQAMPMGPGTFYMPSPMLAPIPAQDWNNSVQWSTRLRLRMGIHLSEHAKIFGRLTMYKVHGGADVPIFNGSPNTVANSFNSGKVPTNDVLHVERASFVYDWPLGVLSIGRQNTSDGPPLEVREGTERQATPQALAVNATVDGIGWKFHLEPLGLPEGSLFGVCYGVGYESGFGGGGNVKANAAVVGFNFFPAANNGTALTPAQYPQPAMQVNNIGPLKDSTVLGAMFDLPLLFEAFGTVHAASFYLGFNRFGNMTDIPFGSLTQFPVPAAPGMGGMPSTQYVTATNNLGDMDQWTATWKHKVADTFTYFVSAGRIKSNPNGKSSQYGAYWNFPAQMPPGYPAGPNVQLAGFGGLLGDPKGSQSASAYYLGLRYDPTPSLGFGLEFNHGSPRWFTYSPATGETTDKLGTRGEVLEAYVHWSFARNISLRLGYLDYKYSHAFSGWHISPGPMQGSWEDAYDLGRNPMLQYAFPAAIKNTYLAIEVKF
jgi:hypothetical protein